MNIQKNFLQSIFWRCTKVDLKISLYICVHIRIISWKCYILNFFSTFHISSTNNFHICLTFLPLPYCRFSFAVSFCQTYSWTILSSTDLLKIWFHSFNIKHVLLKPDSMYFINNSIFALSNVQVCVFLTSFLSSPPFFFLQYQSSISEKTC